MKIGIAGAGGIGSNVAVHLIRSGLRRFKLVDDDRVETGNLNRQYYFHDQVGRVKVDALAENLLRIAPGAQIESVRLRLDQNNMARLFADCDVVVEGFDGRPQKKLLIEALSVLNKT
ncbi:MAG: thiamine biosynthesis protein ThiF, partial [Desulfatitalea sp.]|nr:ThiF family adenylyltransferase [Desulfatitalea sp.]NNK02227.1 thiamine biosynthesis protein ThiF [Desulfatitalea sp.]